MNPYFTLIRGAEMYAPEPLGRQDVLLAGERVLKLGDITQEHVAALGVGYEVVDADGLALTPGLVDGHQHPIGGVVSRGSAAARRPWRCRTWCATASPPWWAASAPTRRHGP